ncbi:MAG: hypothetical protein HRT47_00290 [Candidatus Caenarcaniphilales bacterium]|nr:hypothetical protein [Candidatus Caenarcaniphilales bacterium]
MSATPASAKKVKGEFVFDLPSNFHLAAIEANDSLKLREFIPKNEKIDNWSEMITYGFTSKATNPMTFKLFVLGNLIGIARVCKDNAFVPQPEFKNVGGYLKSDAFSICGKNPLTGKAEITQYSFLKGKDGVYMLQRAVRKPTFNANNKENSQAIVKKYALGTWRSFFEAGFIPDRKKHIKATVQDKQLRKQKLKELKMIQATEFEPLN